MRLARRAHAQLKPPLGAAAVVIFTVLRRAGQAPHTLLVRQYRPPVRDARYLSLLRKARLTPPPCQTAGLTLELPAGLIDPGESPAVAALRELKEETGYVATVRTDGALSLRRARADAGCLAQVRSVSPAACMSPGLTNESVHLVHGALRCWRDNELTDVSAPQQPTSTWTRRRT